MKVTRTKEGLKYEADSYEHQVAMMKRKRAWFADGLKVGALTFLAPSVLIAIDAGSAGPVLMGLVLTVATGVINQIWYQKSF